MNRKRKYCLRNKIMEFRYERGRLDSQIGRIRRSARELNRLLENMTSGTQNGRECRKK